MGMSFDLKEGDRVQWNDPDEESCSCTGVITEIKYAFDDLLIVDAETEIVVQQDGGGIVECWPSELTVLSRLNPEKA